MKHTNCNEHERLKALNVELVEALTMAVEAHDDDKSWEDFAIAVLARAREVSNG